MRHKIWINFTVVLALALGSGGVMTGERPAAQASSTQAWLSAPSGDNIATEEASTPYMADAVSVEYIGHAGGSVNSVALEGGYAYVGEGPSLTILDVSTPSTPAVVGRLEFLPDIVRAVVVDGDYAYVADWFGGLRIIDVSAPTSPIEVGFYDTPGLALDAAVVGGYAYVADGSGGLRVIDVTAPASPSEVGSCATPGDAQGVAVAGVYAYVADGQSGLHLIDVSNPANPSEVGSYATSGSAVGVAVSGDYAYLADGLSGSLRVIDVSDPTSPGEVGTYNMMSVVEDVALAGSYLYVVDWDSGLWVIDVSDPENPSAVGVYITPGNALDVAMVANHAYVADTSSGLRVIDVGDPASPNEVGSYDTLGFATSAVIAEDNVFVADGSGLRVIDVSDPANPSEVGFQATPGLASGVALVGSYAYVAAYDAGLRVVDVSNPASPTEVGSYVNPVYSYTNSLDVEGGYAYTAEGYLMRVIDVSDPANPTAVGFYDAGSPTMDVAVAGGYAYVAAYDGGLRVVDVSDPASPTEVGFYDTPAYAHGVTVEGTYAYVADGQSGLRVIDISDPAKPAEVGFYDTPGDADGVTVVGIYAYVADEQSGLRVIDVSDPASPSEVGIYDTPGNALGLAVMGSYAYVADHVGGLIILKLTEPRAEADTIITSDTPDPSQAGEPIGVTFEVTASSGTPTGTVIVTVAGESDNCLGTLTGGIGGCEIRLNDPGTYTLTATYSGDDHFLSSSTTEWHTVVKGDSATTIHSDGPDPSQVAQPITVTFEVNADYGTPTGAVTVTVAGEVESCTDTLVDGVGECELSLSNPGTYTLTASYSGDGYFLPSSTTEGHMVGKANSTTTILWDNPDPSQAGDPITVAFQVTTDPGTPTGVVTLTVAGQAEICTDTLASGTGECQITLDSPGTYTLIASYAGDERFLPSDAVEQHTVMQQQAVKDVTISTITSDQPDPSPAGQPILVSFEVSADSGTPTGTVTVMVADASCTGTLASGVGACEVQTATTTLEFPGTYTLVATYSGDDHFLPSSDVEQHTIVEQPAIKDATATTILSDEPDPSQVGEPVSVTFSVTASSGVPGGMVHVQVAGEAMDCFGTLIAGIGGCEITVNVPGTFTLTAEYSGDDYFLPSSAVEGHQVGAEPAQLSARIYLPGIFHQYGPDFFDDFGNPGTGRGMGEDEFVR